ncbi:MAG: septum formation initiator family protein [Bacteroidales bacterium]|uniref:FtsB family cell division protein n=1 Tax=Porphyromonas sp. TaxID=1924944 RepID=UPI002970A189|nr:septum formation initiator family protein [Porphyromonas sp.]MDD7437830.1 septum formation initiator family protein [Bacteroidales bacterium]MDY3066423.1 septum formation initiator family protein [Porphyromonas sp.]
MSNVFKKIGSLFGRLWQWLRKVNPFLLLTVVFLVVIVLPGEYSIWNQIKYTREIAKQEREMRELEKNIEKANTEKKELLVEKDRLEKFARERYLMKEEDEDIYLIDE